LIALVESKVLKRIYFLLGFFEVSEEWIKKIL